MNSVRATVISTLSVFVMVGVSGCILFWVSQKVQEAERRQAELMSSIRNEKEGLRVLKAEWDYLNNPERLEALSAQYLNLVPASVGTMIRPDQKIPDAPLFPDDPEKAIYVSTKPPADKPKKAAPQPVAASASAPVLQSATPTHEPKFDDVLNNITKSGGGVAR